MQLYHERAVWELLRICFVDTQLAGSVTQVPAFPPNSLEDQTFAIVSSPFHYACSHKPFL